MFLPITTLWLAKEASRDLLGPCALAVIAIVGLGVLLPAVWSRDPSRRAAARMVLRIMARRSSRRR